MVSEYEATGERWQRLYILHLTTRCGSYVVNQMESTKVWITQKIGKKEETVTEKIKRSPNERHTHTNTQKVN